MAVCTFFGHRDCPETIRPELRRALTELIEHHQVDMFYVGNQGGFDRLVRGVLRELAMEYPHICYAVVLAYLPGENDRQDNSDTMLPEGMELAHPRYASSRRNKWMLNQADYVLTYISHSWGGAARWAEKAQREGKQVYNLYPMK